MIYITHRDQLSAKALADQVVRERLAACANLFSIKSVYWWQQEVQSDDEWVSILKTTPEKWLALRHRVEEIHPYDIPCIIRIDVEASPAYEAWIREEVS